MKTLLTSLKHFLLRYRWWYVLGTVFIIISNALKIYPAQIVRDALNLVGELVYQQRLVEGFSAEEQLNPSIGSTLLLFGGMVLGAALISGFFLFLVRQTIIVTSRKIEYDQKNQLFEHYLGYSLTILRRRQTGDLMARISEDVGAVRMFTGPGIMYTINTITLFAMVMTTMLYVNAELTAYVLIPMPILALTIFIVHSHIIKRSEAMQDQLSTVSNFTQESYSGIRLLKAYARERIMNGLFNRESDKFKDRALSLAKVEALFFPTILLLIGLSTVFAVWIGGEKVIAGTLTMGNIAEFIIYINLLTWPVASLGWITSMIQRAAASQKRINELLALESELHFPEQSPALESPSIQLQNVSFTYPDTGIQALKQIEIDLPAGQVLGIVGTTGSGKTTLVNLLLRLMDPQQGQVQIGNQPIKAYSKLALRGAIGYVPQDVFLFSDTIAGNIAFGSLDASQEAIEDAARFAGVYDDIMDFPKGFETRVGERGVTLSGGQKQRVSIARAYLHKPKLLILDDALSAVDTQTEANILQHLREGFDEQASEQPTLVIVSHRISAVEHAHQIVVMDEGEILECGTHQQLLAQDGKYAELHRKQLLEEEIVLD